MAGAGWRDFVPGEVLTAAKVQDYLQDQAVMVFASAAARTSALASPSEGMVSYLSDTNIVQMYTGSSWLTIADDGGLPIANGGTGATTTAGARAALFTGSVLQVVNASYATQANSTTTTAADTGLTATITPSATSSKILVLVNQAGVSKAGGNSNSAAQLFLYRGATSLLMFEAAGAITYTNMHNTVAAASASYLDSPNTTSAVTYKTTFNCNTASAQIAVQFGGAASTITLLEIGG